MKRVLRVMILFIIVALVFIFWLGMDIKSFGENARAKRADCIVVLGCSVYGTEPSPFLQGRLQEAERLFKEGYGDYIIVSGGKGQGEDISEAQAMKTYLVERGIDSSKIVMEDMSKSTYENIKYSHMKMESLGLSDAIIVSNKFHLRRASYIAKKLGVDASFSGVYMKEHLKSERKGLIREIPAIVFTFFKFLNK